MNELPIMPIRAKYADESTEGKNIDTELDKITDLQEVVGDEDSGLVKQVNENTAAIAGIVPGTKLYKHELTFDNVTVRLIMKTAEPETSYTGGPSRTSVLNFGDLVSCLDYFRIDVQPYDGKILFSAYTVQNFTINGTTFTAYTSKNLGNFVSDTVTPL